MSVKASKVEVRIDGKTYDDQYDFSGIRLNQKIENPNKLRFLMHKDTVPEDGDDIRFSVSEELLGKKVEFFLKTSCKNKNEKTYNDTLEFTGIIFSVNVVRGSINAELTIEVVAYSPDYLLLDSPHCYSYENETLKNIIAKTLEPYKIPLQNNPRMEDEIPYTVQYNESSYAFINRLASRFGEWLYNNGKELVFGKMKKFDSVELQPGCDLLNHQYCLNTGHLNFSYAHHNYLEYGNAKNDALSFTEQSVHNMTDIAYKHSKSLYAKETFQHLESSAAEGSFDETELAAKTQGLGLKARMTVCLGSTNRADLQIGSIIKIKEYFETGNQKTGSCYHDELLICSITHEVDSSGNYTNKFTAIPANCEYPPYTHGNYYPKAGTQRAVVKENQDPENLGRVRVQFLWQQEQDDSLMTPWIRIAQPHGGGDKGFYFIPEIGEEVMVGFENGNAEKPYITGTLYHGNQRPGKDWHNANNDIKAIRTRNGHTVEINDAGEGGFIKIYDHEKENYVLTFSTDEKLIRLESKGNIDLYAEENINIEAKKDINLVSKQNINYDAKENINETAENISTVAEGNISITAKNNMTTLVENNSRLEVTGNHTMEIVGNKKEIITKNSDVEADNITQRANNKLELISKTHDQKADKSMKLDGGGTIDFCGNNIKQS